MNEGIDDRAAARAAAPATADQVDPAWRVLVPVKGGLGAKSRLRPPEGIDRVELARALALDTVTAAVASVGARSVLVVTSDPVVGSRVRALGAESVPDPGQGLNAAVAFAAAAVQGRVAVLLGDVPAVRPAELRSALEAADAYSSAFVPDQEGTGSVLVTATDAARFVPRFGAGSAAAHAADGLVRLDLDLPGLRRDVDDEASLGQALGLGVGPHTAQLLAHLTVL